MIFDSHAHYDDEAFDADREELLAQCQAQGIEYIVNVSASLASVKTTLELARKVEIEIGEDWHRAFYLRLRREMDEYDAAKRRLRLVKNTTEYEEDLYDEVI